MPTIAASHFPAPKSWEEFEDIALSAAKVRWSSSDFYKNGRSGQNQDGVDIFGHDEDGRQIGIQGKNAINGVTEALVREEIKRAELFQPPLYALYIATTARRDARLQSVIRGISKERVGKSQFRVNILFWEDVCDDIATDDETFFKHYPQFRSGPPLGYRIRVHLLYLALMLLAIVLAFSFIPTIFSFTEIAYRSDYLISVTYAAISLSVAMIIFGVLDDASIVRELSSPFSKAIKFGASIAGALAFYWAMTSNLSTSEAKFISLRNVSGANPAGIKKGDALIVTPEFTQIVPIENSVVRAVVPRFVSEFQLVVSSSDGKRWQIKSTEPRKCLVAGTEDRLRNSCGKHIALNIEGRACLQRMELSPSFAGTNIIERSLEEVLQELVNKANIFEVNAHLEYSKRASLAKTQTVSLNGYPGNARGMCSHLVDLENRFNHGSQERKIKIEADCQLLLVKLVNEDDIRPGFANRCTGAL